MWNRNMECSPFLRLNGRQALGHEPCAAAELRHRQAHRAKQGEAELAGVLARGAMVVDALLERATQISRVSLLSP